MEISYEAENMAFTDANDCVEVSENGNGLQTELAVVKPEVVIRRSVFEERFVSYFMAKRRKYKKTLEEYGGVSYVVEHEGSRNGETETSFNEEIEMILSEGNSRLSETCRKNGHFSIAGLFRHIYNLVRRTKASRISSKFQFVSEHDVMETLRDIASQLSSAYEYQILVMADENEVRKMADHAVCCMLCYLKQRHSHFHPDTLLQAVIENVPKIYFQDDQYLKTRNISPSSNHKDLFDKWKIQDVFKQTGLRVYQPHSDTYKFYGCFTPFGYKCKPHKYGFRGPLYAWDENKTAYKMILIDQITCHESHKREIPLIENNFHYTYKPHREAIEPESIGVRIQNDDDLNQNTVIVN